MTKYVAFHVFPWHTYLTPDGEMIHFRERRREIAATAERSKVVEIAQKPTKGGDKSGDKGRSRITISLSSDSIEKLEELKAYTDAETTTDVIRSSLRLAYLIMTAEKNGVRVEARDLSKPEERPGIINIFGTITPG